MLHLNWTPLHCVAESFFVCLSVFVFFLHHHDIQPVIRASYVLGASGRGYGTDGGKVNVAQHAVV